jgi:phosphohistidine phosphatase SixA
MTRIMIIRHAEKHTSGRERGVDFEGFHAKHELTVRGWQRAGALVGFFAPPGGLPAGSPISTPRSILASAATKASPSLRAQHTVLALAELLRIEIDTRYADGEEAAAAAAALAAPGPVLISWHHSHISKLTRLIGGHLPDCPKSWPDDCFDVVWVLDRDDGASGPWRFSQVVQRLFANDRTDPI